MSTNEPLVMDIEAKGFVHHLKGADSFLCGVTVGLYSNKVKSYRPNQLQELVDDLESAEAVIAHNGIFYDAPALEVMSGRKLDTSKWIDTLVLSRLIHPDIYEKTIAGLRKGRIDNGMPKKLIGAHSLKAWGYRLGDNKIDAFENYDWQNGSFSEEMLGYCIQDTLLTKKLYERLVAKEYSVTAIKLEHEFACTISRQIQSGFCFDEEKAFILLAELTDERERMRRTIEETFSGWWVSSGEVVPKRTIRYKNKPHVTKGAPYTKVKWVEFSANSRDHITRVLLAKGWNPQTFTDSGKPKVDETTLANLEFPEGKLFARWFLVQKRIAQLSEGSQGWLKSVRHGKIHGGVNTNGAVTGRCTHSQPNVAQVPSTRAEFGKQCRELFTVPQGWTLLGTDASGLELRCLSHFMSRYDDGAYAEVILNGDIHTANQEAAGLPTRDAAKTFIYAFLYGAGDEKIGSIIGKGSKAGKAIKAKFFKSLPALKLLIESVKAKAKKQGYLRGLDGRKVVVRSQHAALNTLLQSSGALVCKQWTVYTEQLAIESGLRYGWDGDFVFCANIHDEQQIACRTEEIAKHIGQIAQIAMKKVEQKFNFRCPLDTDFSVGKTWADTH